MKDYLRQVKRDAAKETEWRKNPRYRHGRTMRKMKIAICRACLRKSERESVWCLRCPMNAGQDSKTMLIEGDPDYEQVRRQRAEMLRKGRFPILKLRALRAVLYGDPYGEGQIHCQAEGCSVTDAGDLGLWRKHNVPNTGKYGVSSLYPSLVRGTVPSQNYEVYCRLHGVRLGGAPPLEEEPKNKEAKAPAPKTLRMLDVMQAVLAARQGDKQPE